MRASTPLVCSAFVLLCSLASTTATAGVVPIGPFQGDLREPLNGPVGPFGFTIQGSIDVFGGAVTVTTPFYPTTYVHYWLGSSLNGDPVSARTGSYVLGTTQGPQVWEFHTPAMKIGSWFNNNSGANDATVEFFGAGGLSLGTRVANIPAPGNTWTWNGWESDRAIHRVVITGNGVLNGFLWMDDLELTPVPAPGVPGCVLCAAVLAGRRRR